MKVSVLPLGDDALEVRFDDRSLRPAVAACLIRDAVWKEVVPGKLGVAVQFDPLDLSPEDARSRVLEIMQDFRHGLAGVPSRIALTVHVSAEAAPDLERLAELNNTTATALLDQVFGRPVRIDMMGFMPGFAYLECVDPQIHAERLVTPRRHVEAGSVGIVTGQMCLYPITGPAGWPIIGRISERLFDPSAGQPFLLAQGMEVSFRLIGSDP